MNDHQMNLKKVATQAMEEAEKLTDTIDRANAEAKAQTFPAGVQVFCFHPCLAIRKNDSAY